jgi:hypothetical protein
MERHLVVDFGVPGVPVQHYRAEECAARAFAADALRQRLALVTIDDEMATADLNDLRELPYQRLFLPSERNFE